ncbi:unnamed protein product [Porites lobata]|uniref:Protein kinase C and casein kinase substrate in neurons protein 1 n=1 Tax=Porites lobata TaxID=104759 RepID=A0ABN8RM62_9CNID|nr:unnamed protein product [Porites lobata]
MSIRETPRGSDENLYSASTDSFWDVGNFKRTVKRIDDGAKLCDEFMKLVVERANIEAKYAFKLKAWSKKWEECVKSGPEYGTMEAAMLGAVTEAESRAEIHMHCRDKLIDEVHESIKKWKNENYHKGIFQWKETKEADDGFTRAQKPWAKRLAKVERAKKAYQNAARIAEQASKMETEAGHDADKPADKLKKLQDATEKAKREMEKCREKYELRLEEITAYNSQYERDMIQEFERCQENEDTRLTFFKDVLSQYHKCLDISESPEFSGVFVNMSLTFQKADMQADLDWWSRNHGTGMPQNWPVFEEYNEVPLKRSSTRSHGHAAAYPGTQNHIEDNTDYSHKNETVEHNPFNNYTSTSNDDFSDQAGTDEWEPPPVEDAGIPVRALYDFQGIEDDELNFKEGDVLTQLSSQDDQGWCQGRFQGKVGHFPGSYVEPL